MALTALVAASCIAPPSPDKKTRQLLDELDGYLALRGRHMLPRSRISWMYTATWPWPPRTRPVATIWKCWLRKSILPSISTPPSLI